MTRKIVVLFYFALAESFVSEEIRFLPSGIEATFIMVAAVACIAPAGGACTSSGRRAWGAVVSLAAKAAKTSACSSTSLGGRSWVAIVSAAAKTARASACKGHAHIASTVVRSTIVCLFERVVAKEVETIVRAGHCRAWAVLATSTVRGHAAQNKRRVSVHQRPPILCVSILKACGSYF